MGLFDFLKKNKKQEAKVEKVIFEKNDNKQPLEVEEKQNKKPFVADISMYEFENADWTAFGSILKQNRILPNSYIKKPAEIEVTLSKKGQPMVMLTFNSATSSSIRKYMLLQDGVFEYVNGAVDDGKNADLIRVWDRFKEEIRYINYLNTNREETFQTRKAERAIKTAERTKRTLADLYKQEQDFLEKYQDAQFDGFYYQSLILEDDVRIPYGELPQFIMLRKVQDGRYMDGDAVLPFTPKTLEFCILHMTNGQKAEDGEYLESFEKKCRQIQAFSGYESEDWDRVINLGKGIVKNAYLASLLEDEKEQ
ncbi:MAG: hypothetical protein IKC11_04705 [Clostridia bacterium]|nr:hypothetical protein [Clostridia bacterium]